MAFLYILILNVSTFLEEIKMKAVVTLASPETEKEQLFRTETEIDDLRHPGKGHLWIEGKEYLIELYYYAIMQ